MKRVKHTLLYLLAAGAMFLTGCSDDFFGDKTEQHDSNRIQLSGDIDQLAAPRSPYRHLELCGIALIKTTGTLQCTAVFLLFFLQKFIAHGGVSLYIITRVLTRVMNGAILSKLELQKKPRKPHENG